MNKEFNIPCIPVCANCFADMEINEKDNNGNVISWICPECGEIEYKKQMEDLTIIKALIKTFQDYAKINDWTDSEFINELIGIGITKEDFVNCGYGKYIETYIDMF